MLADLQSRGIERASVTLHVGAGTFQPVKTENLAGTRCTASGTKCLWPLAALEPAAANAVAAW